MNISLKKYKFSECEKKWQNLWQETKLYTWDKNESRKNTYVVDTPPPTVSGNLHIGHIYSYVQTDFIVRYQRMKGMNVFYPLGFDDNGLPTERLVEKTKKIKSINMKREEFITICKDVVTREKKKFRDLFRQVGLSVDWNIEYSTMSNVSCILSQMSFIDLMRKKQVYRDLQPILWDPVDRTALSQADVEDKAQFTTMYNIQFTTEHGEQIIIATTRPELLPACVSVFFHPNDNRYTKLTGKFAISPLFSVKVPILSDDMVDPNIGTGLVMCSTFGDQTDIKWWRKYNLPTKNILTKIGTIDQITFDTNCLNTNRAQKLALEIKGCNIKSAREKIVKDLKEAKLLLEQNKKRQIVKCAERSGAELEILMTPQWFVKSIKHKDAILKKSNELMWYPKSMQVKLDVWIDGIMMDWCISRQRYFGIPFPVWYSKRKGEEGKILLASLDQLPVDPRLHTPIGYNANEVEADHDVMDTWFTSSVSPQLNSHGIADGFMLNETRYKKLFPADLRPQAHEILRTWSYYTMLKSYLHTNTLPWKNIMVSGWCLAEDKTKMSKSKGNLIMPEMVLENYGADATRYWASRFKLGSDTAYSEIVINNGKRLLNKIWNAAKFISGHFSKIPESDKASCFQNVKHKIISDFDIYFVSRLLELVNKVTFLYESYEYSIVMDELENFFRFIFCDNYLEIIKYRAYDDEKKSPHTALSARLTLYYAFKVFLQLFAPILPHLTEEIYRLLYSKESIHRRGNWPKLDVQFNNIKINESENLLSILSLVRKIKAHKCLSIKVPIRCLEVQGAKLTDSLILDLMAATSAKKIKIVDQLSSCIHSLSENNISIHIEL